MFFYFSICFSWFDGAVNTSKPGLTADMLWLPGVCCVLAENSRAKKLEPAVRPTCVIIYPPELFIPRTKWPALPSLYGLFVLFTQQKKCVLAAIPSRRYVAGPLSCRPCRGDDPSRRGARIHACSCGHTYASRGLFEVSCLAFSPIGRSISTYVHTTQVPLFRPKPKFGLSLNRTGGRIENLPPCPRLPFD